MVQAGMRFPISRRVIVRAILFVLALLTCALTLALIEQKRTEAELGVVLSAYLSDGILHDAHDWGPARGLLVVLQREAQPPGSLRSRLLYPLDRRFRFTDASLMTRGSFAISNTIPGELGPVLYLPPG